MIILIFPLGVRNDFILGIFIFNRFSTSKDINLIFLSAIKLIRFSINIGAGIVPE